MHGGLTRRQRLARQEAFEQPEVRLLLATDAASEGLNLQRRCRRVIHFELPWNPNRLEQRNGRVDRYGQTREPIVRYLYYPASPEEDVLHQLVAKIENIAKDRVSTPDILGVLAGERRLDEGLVELDPEASDVEAHKAALVRLFEDRTAEFVRSVRPLIAAGSDSSAEQERILALLDTVEPLLVDDEGLEGIVLAILGPGAVRPDTGREGVFRIEVPPAYRDPGVAPVYPAATFRRSVAVRYRAEDVEYLTPLHPLVQALAADARRRLLQVYPGVRGLAPRRLAARIVAAGEPPSVVFTFLGTIEGGGGLLEERILAVRVKTDGEPLADPESNLSFLEEKETAGTVEASAIERLFAARFEAMRERAAEEARRFLEARAESLRQRRLAARVSPEGEQAPSSHWPSRGTAGAAQPGTSGIRLPRHPVLVPTSGQASAPATIRQPDARDDLAHRGSRPTHGYDHARGWLPLHRRRNTWVLRSPGIA